MKTIITNKTIWNIAYPIILGSLAQTLITLTDTAFLGRVSEVALGLPPWPESTIMFFPR